MGPQFDSLPTPYYDADGITIYHADALDIINALTYDVLVTDPPYFGREDLFPTDGYTGSHPPPEYQRSSSGPS